MKAAKTRFLYGLAGLDGPMSASSIHGFKLETSDIGHPQSSSVLVSSDSTSPYTCPTGKSCVEPKQQFRPQLELEYSKLPLSRPTFSHQRRHLATCLHATSDIRHINNLVYHLYTQEKHPNLHHHETTHSIPPPPLLSPLHNFRHHSRLQPCARRRQILRLQRSRRPAQRHDLRRPSAGGREHDVHGGHMPAIKEDKGRAEDG